jgi:glucosamine--fructose-6-phosphate aminotransferase (isomerizing)
MREQILATPDALQSALVEIERAVRAVLSTPEIYRIRRIVLTGSGDSRFAAKAAEMALIEHAALPVEVRPPMEGGRYHAQASARRDLENTLLIALSNSGAAARVAEATALYRAGGAGALAITRAGDSRLAAAAGRALLLAVPPLPAGPGFAPYLFQFCALALLSIRFGEVRMSITMDQAQSLRNELTNRVLELGEVIRLSDETCRKAAARLAETRVFEFVGAGPSFAVAEYAAAKMLEAVGRHAVAADIEEWAHLNYFDAAPDEIATHVFVPSGSRAESRAIELIAYMTKLGRAVTVIGAGGAADAARRLGHAVLEVESNAAESWSPLLLSAPPALLTAHLAAATGAEYGRGAKGRWSDAADSSTVQKSMLWAGTP